MKKNLSKYISILILFSLSNAAGQNLLPKIYSGDAQKIFTLRKAYLKGDKKYQAAVKYLERQAEKLLDTEPYSVMAKDQLPPGGDKHDYMSMGKYWWPNPDTKDGLPYIRRDGEVNPESNGITDPLYIGRLISNVEVLSVAYYVTDNPKYSGKAAELLRVWFLNDDTRMNPNLKYAQSAKGKNEGTKSGIIDFHSIYRLVDAIGLLENSKEWSKEDDLRIRKWFDEYLTWLMTSKNGIDESKSKNNHGSWYDVQKVSILLFLGKNDEAKEHLETYSKQRIDSQIMEDGKQPEELARTNGMSYTQFNLKALFSLAELGDKAGVDLWTYIGKNNGSIRKALDFFLPFALDPSRWEYKQISPYKSTDLYSILLISQKKYDDKIYSGWRTKIFGDKAKITIENFL